MSNEPTIHVGITDHLDPEVNAMVSAMYSRNAEPILARLPSTNETSLEHKEKMAKYYVNYGHKSVGQLGTTTIFFEGVSQLAAKALENHPLYNGQECSSRYIDFSNQPMYSNDEEITLWQEKFRAFYIKALPLVIDKIKAEYPFNQADYVIKTSHNEASKSNSNKQNVFIDDKLKYVINNENPYIWAIDPVDKNENFKDLNYSSLDEALEVIKTFEFTKKINSAETIWNNTCKARAFDICRGILPAGVTTSLAFTGTFDTLNDHLGEMLYHPSKEMRDVAKTTLVKMKEVYPYATKSINKLKEQFKYIDQNYFYQKADIALKGIVLSDGFKDNLYALNWNREKFEKLPRYEASKFRVSFTSELDFGSFRDLQRHRNGYINMPILTPLNFFDHFYKSNLTKPLHDELNLLLEDYKVWYKTTTYLSEIDKQYSTPMGYNCLVNYECDVNQMLYLMELRSSKTVHQTLRTYVYRWQHELGLNQNKIKIYSDTDLDNFTLKRGTQTFIQS